MDVRKMNLPSASFDLIIDKSTMDALLCGKNSFLNVARMLQNDEDIEETTGKEIEALQADLDEAQKDAMRSVSKQASAQVKY